ncbi:hypothetical protein RchiOBHm_Chr4g0395561 [Rosa chinensis]|uniref:Uncharacterized protein n=1 Tax=Rosa chinensis TaxID=74649 RepID=A0A2P6QRJ0_ROSCH|nr:hypothetical protein RchiOBHm_Chr4g0395561 [Rosa chinensis]
MLPTGKAGLEDLRCLFARPGLRIFRDATIPISFVGPHVVEFLISQRTRISGFDFFFNKAVSGFSGLELMALLKPAIASGNANLISSLIDSNLHEDLNLRHLIRPADFGSWGIFAWRS